MSDGSTVVATAIVAPATAALGASSVFGIDLAIMAGAVSGVAVFMLQSTDRTIPQRIALFVPSSIGTAFGADAIANWFSLSSRMTPIIAFILGLIIVVASSAWIRKAQTRGFLASILEKFLPDRGNGKNR